MLVNSGFSFKGDHIIKKIKAKKFEGGNIALKIVFGEEEGREEVNDTNTQSG